VISQVNPFQRPQLNVQSSPQNIQSKVQFNQPVQPVQQNQQNLPINKTTVVINLNESESEKEEEMSFFLKSLKGFKSESDQINLSKLQSHLNTANPSHVIQSNSNLNEMSFSNANVSISEQSEQLSRDPRKKFKRK
jgi:hypothetical protein